LWIFQEPALAIWAGEKVANTLEIGEMDGVGDFDFLVIHRADGETGTFAGQADLKARDICVIAIIKVL
jgi:hypothetical protein